MTDTPPPVNPTSPTADKARHWRAHSRRVMLFRRVLPVMILLLAGGTVAWIGLRSAISDAERRAEQRSDVALDNALYYGQDDQGRSFVIGAKGVVRVPETGHLRLVGPVLRLNLGGAKVTEMTADGGTYDEASRRVIIGPNVRISDGGSGFVLTTPEAVVDTRTGVVTGDKGVQGTGPLGTMAATSYVIRDQGESIEFRGTVENKVRGTINPASSRR